MTDLDQLSRLRPDVSDPTPEWLAATRQALLEHAEGTRPRRARSNRGTLIALAAGVAVLAVIALVMPASSTLTPSNRHDQFVYVKEGFADEKNGQLTLSEGWYRTDSGKPQLRPTAKPNCPTGSIVTSPSSAAPSSSGPYTGCSGPFPSPGQVRDLLVPSYPEPGIIGWSRQQLETLPTDPEVLRSRLYDMAKDIIVHAPKSPPDSQDYAAAPDEQVFALIMGTLLKAIAPQPVVTALYQVALTIPGVTVDQNVADAAGRSGVGVTRSPDNGKGYRETLVFDRDSRRFLGSNGVAIGWSDYVPSIVILSSGLVDHLGDRL
ncbi:hypothetical protein [Kutzneria sp. CA-103260]|uniref:hypothetical protein n=1 Tax=Kutzneria sp. CA-103260 TaxID=2802641 RepID=UPI001BA5228C|nr:hypothetical protein [Kutzneria sp. CA-103260]QUQ72280.1 hypothetical protein JJ691_100680 [Kutzneria sp. CA-103260]